MQNKEHPAIDAYGVKLKPLLFTDLELVRRWRNDPKIIRYMEFRDYITEEMQINWFRKIQNGNNYFFIVEFEEKNIALANIKDVDFVRKSGEGGLFIWDDDYLDSIVSYKITYALYDFAFEKLSLEQIDCHIISDNKRAIDYNKSLGFKLSSNQENVINQHYNLTKTDYYSKKSKVIKYVING